MLLAGIARVIKGWESEDPRLAVNLLSCFAEVRWITATKELLLEYLCNGSRSHRKESIYKEKKSAPWNWISWDILGNPLFQLPFSNCVHGPQLARESRSAVTCTRTGSS